MGGKLNLAVCGMLELYDYSCHLPEQNKQAWRNVSEAAVLLGKL